VEHIESVLYENYLKKNMKTTKVLKKRRMAEIACL